MAESFTPEELFKEGEKLYNSLEYDKAFPLIKQAAESGHVDAQVSFYFILLYVKELLGLCYYGGRGVQEDFAKWYVSIEFNEEQFRMDKKSCFAR